MKPEFRPWQAISTGMEQFWVLTLSASESLISKDCRILFIKCDRVQVWAWTSYSNAALGQNVVQSNLLLPASLSSFLHKHNQMSGCRTSELLCTVEKTVSTYLGDNSDIAAQQESMNILGYLQGLWQGLSLCDSSILQYIHRPWAILAFHTGQEQSIQ